MDEIRVLVVADDPLARAGLAALLADQEGCIVAGQVAPGLDLSGDAAVYQPDVVLWDLGWDADPGPLQDLSGGVLPVLVLLPDDALIADVWSAGAQGLLRRDSDPENVTAALRAVAQDLVVLDPVLAPTILPARDREDEPLVEALTPREEEVLHLLADGLSNKAIALQLGISDHTVKFHVNAILGKLGAQSRTEAVVRATRMGLLVL